MVSVRWKRVENVPLIFEDVDMATFAVPTAVFSPEAQTASLQVQRLIERSKKGEQQACVSLFQAPSRRIYTLSLRLAGNVSAAEKLTRDIFVEAFSNLDAVYDDDAFAAWLYHHAAKTVIANQQGRSPEVPVPFGSVFPKFRAAPRDCRWVS
jgi:DNA-directed RNA polymerase specialized sigma24 family protein